MLSVNTFKKSDNITLTGLANYLLRDRLIDEKVIQSAINTIHQQETTLTCYLVRNNILSSQIILDYCAKQFSLPVFDLTNSNHDWTSENTLKPDIIYRYRVLPLFHDQKYLYLGITDPTDHETMAVIAFHAGLSIRPMLIAEEELDKIIQAYFHPTDLNSKLESTLSKIAPIEQPALLQESIEQDDEPVIKFVDQLIQNAVENHISDIHIEPYEQQCRIRFRQDGLLHEATIIPHHLAARVITRLKIMANLNIAERRLPQDGRIQLHQSSKIDVRVNTCPTLFGEKIVLRILDIHHINLDIDLLGFTNPQKKLFIDKLTQPQGLILVTGPTGSGKTSTLYSALHYLNQTEKNISTAEDPVEIELQGINQVHVNPKIGLDFASVLRTFLRQDPDIIMVGEIRDIDTATIAMQAAQTGHLVLSTLHTNSAIETINRLHSMGVAAYNLISSISLIIAQRLIRKLCSRCKQPEILPAEFRDQFKLSSSFVAYRAIGCEYCHQGYKGRTGIFELLPITEQIAQTLLSGNNISTLLTEIKSTGLMLLQEAGLEKVRHGITSIAEMVRVLGI